MPLKVKNLGNSFCSITAGLVKHNDVKYIASWEVKMLLWIGGYNLQFIMDEQ